VVLKAVTVALAIASISVLALPLDAQTPRAGGPPQGAGAAGAPGGGGPRGRQGGQGGEAGRGRGAAAPAPPVRRLPDGKPNLQGVYMADPGGANYGLERRTPADPMTPRTRGVVVDPPDGILPLQPWARQEVANRERPERGYDDPTAHCFVAGVPRSMYVPSPLQILQPPGYVVILHERMSWRIIPLDRKHDLPDHVRLWQGDSVGRWEGDTLVVESKNFNGRTWLNEVGDMTSHALTVVERFTPVNARRIDYRATLTDPVVYTRPFTIAFPLNLQDDELLEVACLEDDQDLKHLKDVKDEFEKSQKK
jgi:hypothetical protein